tara:strand:- start:547 stop:1014 length:468 start_codon:yes stop_codon:yes gene_type:complete
MKLFTPTYIALFGYLIVIIIFLIPPKKYNPSTGEDVRSNNFSTSQIIGFIIFLLIAVFTLYTINCLNLNHHIMKKKMVSNTGDIFSRNTATISRNTLNQELNKAINPDNNCILMAWVLSIIILCICIIVFSIGYTSKFVTQSKSKTSVLQQLAKN